MFYINAAGHMSIIFDRGEELDGRSGGEKEYAGGGCRAMTVGEKAGWKR